MRFAVSSPSNRSRAPRRAAGAAALALAAVLACSHGPDVPPEPALATVHSARLREQMGRLEKVAIGDLSVATRAPTVRRDLAEIALDLEQIASRLPDLVYTLDLDAEQRSHFVLFADSLGASAIRLGEAAPSAPGTVIQERIDEVANACAGCHWAYRASPGI
jgi:cytochrome c556